MKRLVVDTGPILHLQEAGALDLLPLIGEVLFPPLVLVELRMHAPLLWADQFPVWARPHALSSAAEVQALSWQNADLLHAGEAEALALAVQVRPDWFLTDDAAARLMAEALGLEVHGSLGVLLWSAANKLISKPEAESFLTGLEQSSLWLSARVRQQARAALERIFNQNG